MTKEDFCKDCMLYPCPDCDDDTETLECDYKKPFPELDDLRKKE